jgi:hypothetical protein
MRCMGLGVNAGTTGTSRCALTIVLAVVVFCSDASLAESLHRLSGAQIRTQVTGKVITDGTHWRETYDPGGIGRGKVESFERMPQWGSDRGRHVHRQYGRSPSVPPDPSGMVVGANNLFIADASVMPGVSRTNPTPYDHDRRAHRQVGAQACDA